MIVLAGESLPTLKQSVVSREEQCDVSMHINVTLQVGHCLIELIILSVLSLWNTDAFLKFAVKSAL